jgi:hypothetical protein
MYRCWLLVFVCFLISEAEAGHKGGYKRKRRDERLREREEARKRKEAVLEAEETIVHVKLRNARVRCNTTAGELIIDVKQNWSPKGVQR